MGALADLVADVHAGGEAAVRVQALLRGRRARDERRRRAQAAAEAALRCKAHDEEMEELLNDIIYQ